MPSVSLTFIAADRRSVSFNYDGPDWLIPRNGQESSITWGGWSSGDTYSTRSGKSTQVVYDNESGCKTKWSWTFSGGSGGSSSNKSDTSIRGKTINGFTPGKHCSIKGTLHAKRTCKLKTRNYSQSRTRTKTEIIGKDGKGTGKYTYTDWVVHPEHVVSTSYSNRSDYDLGTESDTLWFYTRPDKFLWNTIPATDVFIHYSLTASKWNELMNKAIQRYNWKYCNGNSNVHPKSEGQNQVNSNDLITAEIYNAGAALCGVSRRVTGSSANNAGTVIYAFYFTELSAAVNAK